MRVHVLSVFVPCWSWCQSVGPLTLPPASPSSEWRRPWPRWWSHRTSKSDRPLLLFKIPPRPSTSLFLGWRRSPLGDPADPRRGRTAAAAAACSPFLTLSVKAKQVSSPDDNFLWRRSHPKAFFFFKFQAPPFFLFFFTSVSSSGWVLRPLWNLQT